MANQTNKPNWNAARTQAMAVMGKATGNPMAKATPKAAPKVNPTNPANPANPLNPADTPMGTNDMLQGMTTQMDSMMSMMQDMSAKMDVLTGGNVQGGTIGGGAPGNGING